MSEVTAEMIERGRGADPRAAAERRRIALQVREAREKLTSSGSGHRSFDMELLRLYAERRRAALPALAVLALALAAVAARWAPLPWLFAWLALVGTALLGGRTLAARFLARKPAEIDVKRWSRLFLAAETAQGVAWALVALLAQAGSIQGGGQPYATTFMLVALLLVAATGATVTASIPAAVYASLAPIALAIVAMQRPASVAADGWLIAALSLGALCYFVDLARKLHASALQSLSFQLDKVDLIGELEESRANSELARAKAEESNIAKSRFLATISHELRTPLNAILGFSEVMKAELFGAHAVPAYKDYAHDIHSSGEHLLTLINELLDLSRVEAGHYELREEMIDLEAVIEECRHLVGLRAKKKDIAILQEAGERLPRLWADERALRQVALNLLSNAIKFTPQGGQVRIRLGWTEAGGQYFSITDTGAGIPESELPVVMASFGRGALAHKSAEEGTGLGLPIVKGLVDLHGGTFALKSKVREGTTVTVTFPPARVMSVLPHVEVAAEPVLRSAA